MARSKLRVRIGPQGEMAVIDPGYDTLPLLREVDSGYNISVSHSPPLPHSARFLDVRRVGVGLSRQALEQGTTSNLWMLHRAHMLQLLDGDCRTVGDGEASLLDLKAHLGRRMLRRCQLCARGCAVDRSRRPAGACRLGPNAFVAEHFVHIAEESPINPSLVLNLNGCGLRCRYCQQHEILGRQSKGSQRLDAALWKQLDTEGARSMSFVGGNPDESLPAILEFLSSAPTDWVLPIVWNNHAYSTPEVIQLLEGVVDAYVPDFKYVNENCAQSLSGVRHYARAARRAITAMLSQAVPVLVRILVLPGHLECCHRPALEYLAGINRELLCVSIRGQYSPDWKIGAADGPLQARTHPEELAAVMDCAARLGLAAV